ncbi:hypothetical protein FRC11_005025, partial [Ceratobasidium sp. 423]
MYRHLRTCVKKKKGEPACAAPQVKVQTVFTGDAYRKDFRISPQLAPTGPCATINIAGDPTDMAFEGFLHARKEVPHVKPSATSRSVKETWPFVHYQHWDKLVAGHEPADLIKLVELPVRGDDLHALVKWCEDLFNEQQLVMEDSAHEMIRKLINDAEDGKEAKPFKEVQSRETRNRYAHTWAAILSFVIRMRQRHLDIRAKGTSAASQNTLFNSFLTSDQVKWAWKTNDALNGVTGSEKLSNCIHQLSMACFCPTSTEHMEASKFKDIVATFIVLNNLKVDGTFKQPNHIAPGLADIQYLMRMVVFQQVVQLNQDKGISLLAATKKLKCFVSSKEVTPFGALQQVKHLVQHYSQTTTGLPRIAWTNLTGERLQLDGHIIVMEKLKEMVISLIEETRKMLFEKVLLGLTLEELKYEFHKETCLIDDLSRLTPGYSVFSDLLNPFVHMDTLLAKAFLQNPKVKGMFHSGLDKDGAPIWIRKRLVEWLQAVDAVTERMADLMHILGGQPGRGGEFCGIKIFNTLLRGHNIFWVDGVLVYVLYYSKTTSITEQDRVIVHGLPWEVTELFMVLNGLVRPLVVDWTHHLYGEARASVQAQHVFACDGIPYSSARISKSLGRITLEYLGFSMGIAQWQHLLIAIMRRHLLWIEANEDADQENCALDMISGHTTRLGNRLYAIKLSEWTLMSSTAAIKFITASQAAHDWMLKPIRTLSLALAADAKASNSPSTQSLILAPTSSHATGQTHIQALDATQVEQILQAAEARFAQQAAKLAHNEVSQALVPLTEQLATFHIRPPLSSLVMPGPVHLQALRQFLSKPDAHFQCPAQGVALATIMARKVNLLTVLPTGAGKSALFMAPAKVEPMVTIVVAPLVALKMDLQQRAEDAGVICSEWAHNLIQDRGMTLISAETAGVESFMEWAQVARNQGKLARVVVDEPHILNTSKHFRPLLSAVSNLGTLGVPIILTTATLPPDQEPHIKQALGMATMSIIRNSTQRPEIQYHAAQYKSGQEKAAAINHANAYIAQLQPGETILLQCREKELAKEIAATGGWPVFHADLLESEKEELLSGWRSGTIQCLVATGALGVGVHHPACRVVVHIGVPYGVVDFFQESGRCGRDGWPALSVILWSKPFPPAMPEVDFNGYQALKSMLNDGLGCRRYHMSAYLDGQDLARTCSDSKCMLCDNCTRESEWLSAQPVPLWQVPEKAPIEPVILVHAGVIAVASWNVDKSKAQTPNSRESRSLQAAPVATKKHPSSSASSGEIVRQPSEHFLVPSARRTPSTTSTSYSFPTQRLAPLQVPLPAPASPGGNKEDSDESDSNTSLQDLAPMDPSSVSGFTSAKLQGAMSYLEGRCMACLIEQKDNMHLIADCPNTMGTSPRHCMAHLGTGQSLEDIKAQTRNMPWGVACYTCWWPGGTWHAKFMRGKVTCTQEDQVPQLAWAIYHQKKLRKEFK